MDDQFKQLVENSKSILILLPSKPFFDQVTAALALFLALREKRDTQIVSSAPMTVDFNRIIGINKITQEMGNKNLVLRFLDYKPDDIERIKYDLDQGQMFLTIIPKPGAKAPAKDQVQMNYAGVSADTVFLVGGLNDSHFPQLANKDLGSAKVAHIGTKDIMLSGGTHPISLARPASSVSELVYYYLKISEYEIDRDVASDLLMGIEQETENFTDTNATADTFMAIADLLKRGAKRFASIGHALPGSYPPGSIPGMPPMQGQRPQIPQGMPMPQMQGQPLPQYPMPMPPGGYTQQPQAPRPVYQQPQQGQPMPQPRPQQPRPPMPPMQQMSMSQPQQQTQAPRQPRQQRPPQQSPQQQVEEQDQNENDASFDENPPSEWLAKPKVYKGTSVS